ncbi:MAG: DegT/DnrJ/EryC1/StrS family aminotransferase [Cryomorphaceae bacterium]|nr:DegT/DnrJ/EryC1/StrS family aminotransferase [Cryomorphaceae bacterium]
MQQIQMVDLMAQYAHIQDEIDQAVLNVIKSSKYINGPEVHKFSDDLSKYLGDAHVIPCANGTDALQIALMGLGLKPGDEVITATFTYVATAEVIALLGLKPVLVDVHPDTFLIDVDAVEKAITERTKAIVPVHLFGQCADMERLNALAEKHNLYIVEDTAQAIGSEITLSNGKTLKAGTIGHIGCTSFFPSKNLGCFGDGGAMFTRDKDLADRLRKVANHGQSVQYYHDIVGVNSRLDSIQAAILNVKLPHLDSYNQRRREAAHRYNHLLSSQSKVKTPVEVGYSTHVYHQYTLILDASVDRDGLKQYLSEQGIPAMIYYPVPLHEQKAYLQEDDVRFPATESLCKHVISLPMHSELTIEQQEHIVKHINKFLNTHS